MKGVPIAECSTYTKTVFSQQPAGPSARDDAICFGSGSFACDQDHVRGGFQRGAVAMAADRTNHIDSTLEQIAHPGLLWAGESIATLN